ncbi:peptidoglycan binding protein CsiV [Pseudomonas sp. LS44]|uniref:peptidoglycan binding protein CsiV n=1 Tax=Pseudomonas sp. LS44 TaxID=1357074 RepID=UPI00215A1484|nr:peptidoglycan binding protein CsiV [Pseudomonas sp. LS44]UVE19217.1 peptidoglycan binding protein CsiV [Pseudomonas sp. LS44]
MRMFRHLALLLALFAPLAVADGQYLIELIIFRQAGEPVPASQPAPDDWAGGAQSIAGTERGTALDGEAAKLSPNAGYEVLLHKAWAQNLSAVPSKVALSSGDQHFGHFPVEGTVSLTQVRFTDATVEFWINQFDADGLLTGSERLKQSTRLKNGELTYLDHSNLGVLIKIVPL